WKPRQSLCCKRRFLDMTSSFAPDRLMSSPLRRRSANIANAAWPSGQVTALSLSPAQAMEPIAMEPVVPQMNSLSVPAQFTGQAQLKVAGPNLTYAAPLSPRVSCASRSGTSSVPMPQPCAWTPCMQWPALSPSMCYAPSYPEVPALPTARAAQAAHAARAAQAHAAPSHPGYPMHPVSHSSGELQEQLLHDKLLQDQLQELHSSILRDVEEHIAQLRKRPAKDIPERVQLLPPQVQRRASTGTPSHESWNESPGPSAASALMWRKGAGKGWDSSTKNSELEWTAFVTSRQQASSPRARLRETLRERACRELSFSPSRSSPRQPKETKFSPPTAYKELSSWELAEKTPWVDVQTARKVDMELHSSSPATVNQAFASSLRTSASRTLRPSSTPELVRAETSRNCGKVDSAFEARAAELLWNVS
ncbi:unnamed protein product, partial [Effrenium voratum]